jgi:nitroreductase
MAAPSANNKQPWHFVVITERAILDAIPNFHPYSHMLFEAPLAILVCGDSGLESNSGYIAQDCSASVENILIAARGLGLGTVWLGVYPREGRMKGMWDLLKIPDSFIPFALISIGYPAEEKPPSHRYSEMKVHLNKW